MIRDNVITYAASPHPLLTWTPASPTIRAVLTAALTTLLSYQLAAALSDLVLGLRRHGTSRIHDFLLLILSRRSSPVALLHALFNPHHSHFPTPDPHTHHLPAKHVPRLRRRTLSRLLLLLLLPPLANIIALILTLEYSQTLTFHTAQFGGIALGITPNPVLHNQTSNTCSTAVFRTPPLEKSLVDFIICTTVVYSDQVVDTEIASIAIQAHSAYAFDGVLSTGAGSVGFTSSAYLVSRSTQSDPEPAWTVAHNVAQPDVEALVSYVVDELKPWCGGDNVQVNVTDVEDQNPNMAHVDAFLHKTVACGGKTTERDAPFFNALSKRMLRRISFVNAPHMHIQRPDHLTGFQSGNTFVSADAHDLAVRRRPYATFGVLCVVCAAVVVMRILVRCFTRNDVSRGIGLVVREFIGFSCLDTLLASAETVEYKSYPLGRFWRAPEEPYQPYSR